MVKEIQVKSFPFPKTLGPDKARRKWEEVMGSSPTLLAAKRSLGKYPTHFE